MPTYQILDAGDRREGIAHQAAQFKNLQDRFRQCRLVGPKGTPENFQSLFEKLMSKLEDAREQSITPPERHFEEARKKIEAGHYSFSVDKAEQSTS